MVQTVLRVGFYPVSVSYDSPSPAYPCPTRTGSCFVDLALPHRFLPIGFLALLILTQVACEPAAQVRIYETSKSESTFVNGPLSQNEGRLGPSASGSNRAAQPMGPNAAGQPTAGPRRILGAIIPTDQGCYFLKATDSPERLEPLLADLRTLVETFSIDPQTGRPSNQMPEGWQMNPRNDIAIAELVSPEATGRVKFTVTALAMPPQQDWPGYLLSNVNRWRGQLKLQELTAESLNDTLIKVPRSGFATPSYIFDAVGTGTGGMSPAGTPSSQSSSRSPASEPQPSPTTTEASATKRPTLEYELPEGWSVGQGSQFRLATLNVQSKDGSGEVTVSMATDNPQANTMMWLQQVAKESDPAKLEPMVEKTVQGAQKFAVGEKQATLYEIRTSEQTNAPALLVASLPSDTPELHLFVKLVGDNQLVSAQKDNLIQFVQSLKIK